MYSKMMNQKMFMKWLKDFNHREFMKDTNGDGRLYEVYKAIYEQAVRDTEDRLTNAFYEELEIEYNRGYDDGVDSVEKY